MMAFDMGGPVNKAAYFFAMAASEGGNWAAGGCDGRRHGSPVGRWPGHAGRQKQVH
jgi:hypothetical protein